jgi:hypothetical protein
MPVSGVPRVKGGFWFVELALALGISSLVWPAIGWPLYLISDLAVAGWRLLYEARELSLIPFGGQVVATRSLPAHPSSCGKLAADVWGRRAVPLLGGLCGKGKSSLCLAARRRCAPSNSKLEI